MTYEQLLDRIIADGIAEVRKVYADPKDHHKRDGAIDGFEACRGKQPAEIVALWTEADRQANPVAEECREKTRDAVVARRQDYWKRRYKALQLEWVCNVISVGLVNNGQAPLLAHLPTARAAMKYAAIVGVRGEGVHA